MQKGTFDAKIGLARMLEGGVIMDVMSAEQARIAEDAGAAAVMALERVPAMIRRDGGVARAADPLLVQAIQETVSIPVMAKCRIGHFVEARLLESLEVDFIDESEVLTIADHEQHIDKHPFAVPFVCGCRSLGEALRRVAEGAALIRTKGEAGTGDVSEAVRHLRALRAELDELRDAHADARANAARTMRVPEELVAAVATTGELPVPRFAAGGIATPADAALCMALGAQAVFVGSGIFLSEHPARTARAIVLATTHWREPARVLEASRGLGTPMTSVEVSRLEQTARFAGREAARA